MDLHVACFATSGRHCATEQGSLSCGFCCSKVHYNRFVKHQTLQNQIKLFLHVCIPQSQQPHQKPIKGVATWDQQVTSNNNHNVYRHGPRDGSEHTKLGWGSGSQLGEYVKLRHVQTCWELSFVLVLHVWMRMFYSLCSFCMLLYIIVFWGNQPNCTCLR